MKTSLMFSLLIFLNIGLTGCDKSKVDPNIVYSEENKSPLEALETEDVISKDIPYQHQFYVPVYSNIYVDEDNPKVMLSATLSIRNTSLNDSFYVTKIDYYNTKGDFVRHYLNNSIELPPMGTLNYIVEKLDDTGGAGANFVLDIESNSMDIQPLIETIMIGTFSNKGFAFNSSAMAMNPTDQKTKPKDNP